MAEISSEVLYQRWVHSHEENTDAEMVFRPAHYGFPPSRGRIGFDLKPDGTYTAIGIAPTDGPLPTEGTWKLSGGNVVHYKLVMLKNNVPWRLSPRILIVSSSRSSLLDDRFHSS